jgi:hypothetical protein
MQRLFYTMGALVFALLLPQVVSAATLNFDVIDQIGTRYVIEAKIQGGTDINGIEFDLEVTDGGRIVSLSETDRIIAFWAEGPEIRDGLSRMKGAGVSLVSLRNEVVFQLQVEPGYRGSYLVADSAQAAIADGSGSLVKIEAPPLFLAALDTVEEDLLPGVPSDIIPPKMSQPVWIDGGLEGESFWSLAARDSESGLYGYYIIEGPHESFVRQPFYQPKSRWPYATSITAYDHAGNSTTVTVVRPGWWCGDRYCTVILPLVYLAVSLLVWVLIFLIRVRTSFGTAFFRFTWRGAMRRFVAWHCAFKRVCRIPGSKNEPNDHTGR